MQRAQFWLEFDSLKWTLLCVSSMFIVQKLLKVLLKYLMKWECCEKNVWYFLTIFARSIKFFKVKMVDFKDHINFGHLSETCFSFFFCRPILYSNKMIVISILILQYYCIDTNAARYQSYWIELDWFWKFDSKFLFKIHQTPETFRFKV